MFPKTDSKEAKELLLTTEGGHVEGGAEFPILPSSADASSELQRWVERQFGRAVGFRVGVGVHAGVSNRFAVGGSFAQHTGQWCCRSCDLGDLNRTTPSSAAAVRYIMLPDGC